MAVTISDIGNGDVSTYYESGDGAGNASDWRITKISSYELNFVQEFQGVEYTLWLRGQFDTAKLPTDATTLEDLRGLSESVLYSGMGVQNMFALSFSTPITAQTLNEFTEPKSNLDYEHFFSGNDTYRTTAEASFDSSSSMFLYDGNDKLYQNHHVMKWNDNFYGGSGIDTLILPSLHSNYTIQASNYVWDSIHDVGNLPGHFVSDLTGNINTTQINEVERLQFADGNIALDSAKGENAGMAYRIYKAAFDRVPDAEGLGFWINALDQGYSLEQVATIVMTSPEFQQVYGVNSSNNVFVNLLYQHVLHRDADSDGLNFWNSALNAGYSRGAVLAVYTECPETIELTAELVASGIHYKEWIA